MSFGVALATHNGQRHLGVQLESLLRQSRLPDQVVIADDASMDDTLLIAEAFKRSAPCRVDVLPSTKRHGPFGNFWRAIEACETDFVAFCDQDDVWMPTKVEVCERALIGSGAWAAIHSVDAFRVTDTGGQAREPDIRVPSATVDGLCLAPTFVVHGMNMVIRKELMRLGSPVKECWDRWFDTVEQTRPVGNLDHWSHGHDTYALTIARMLGPITLIPEVLALWRSHDTNYTKASNWVQSPEISTSWGHGARAGYHVLSRSCLDFRAMWHDPKCHTGLAEARVSAVAEYYSRWATIWSARATICERDAQWRTRLTGVWNVWIAGGYRGSFDGGLGARAFARDALSLLRVGLT